MPDPIVKFRGDRTLYSSILLEWEIASPGATVHIRKKLGDFPTDMEDGDFVYQGPAVIERVNDPDVDNATWYYYKTWFFDTTLAQWVTRANLRAEVLAVVPRADFKDIAKKNMPGMYSVNELSFSPDEPESWQAVRDEIIVKVFEEVDALIPALKVVRDVDEAPGFVLPGLARLVGLVPNLELSYTRQREEIRNAIFAWKTKGTAKSVKSQIKAVSGLEAQIVEYVPHILRANVDDNTSVDFNDPNQTDPEDPDVDDAAYYSLDFRLDDKPDFFAKYNTFAVGIFIDHEDGELTQEIVRKFRRIVPDFVPVFVIPIVRVRSTEAPVQEFYDTPTDDADDDEEDTFVDPIVRVGRTNRLIHRSNSLSSRSAGYVARDTWWDEVEIQ